MKHSVFVICLYLWSILDSIHAPLIQPKMDERVTSLRRKESHLNVPLNNGILHRFWHPNQLRSQNRITIVSPTHQVLDNQSNPFGNLRPLFGISLCKARRSVNTSNVPALLMLVSICGMQSRYALATL